MGSSEAFGRLVDLNTTETCNVPKFMKFKLCSNLIQNIKNINK
jgi:hypothetical protein